MKSSYHFVRLIWYDLLLRQKGPFDYHSPKSTNDVCDTIDFTKQVH